MKVARTRRAVPGFSYLFPNFIVNTVPDVLFLVKGVFFPDERYSWALMDS